MFNIVRKSPIPLGDQLVERVVELIESGRQPEGSRLPSVRQLARRVGVSVYTVTSAFERLSACGHPAGEGCDVLDKRPGRRLSENQCSIWQRPHADTVPRLALRGRGLMRAFAQGLSTHSTHPQVAT